MSQIFGTDKKIIILCFITAGLTVIAGILHLMMGPGQFSRNLGQGILFVVGGILQIFWAVPVIMRWGRIWQIIGIVGTAIFVILFFSSRFHILPEVNFFGGMQQSIQSGGIPPSDFPRGNLTGGEFPRGNPPRGMGFGLGGNALVIEVSQIVFIGLYAILSSVSKKLPKNDRVI